MTASRKIDPRRLLGVRITLDRNGGAKIGQKPDTKPVSRLNAKIGQKPGAKPSPRLSAKVGTKAGVKG